VNSGETILALPLITAAIISTLHYNFQHKSHSFFTDFSQKDFKTEPKYHRSGALLSLFYGDFT
jgi:hypothetical protein